MSDIQTVVVGKDLVRRGISMLPPRVSAPLIKALDEGRAKKLTAKQTNLVVVIVNNALGRDIVTLEDVARKRGNVAADATKRGCLDPCDGIPVTKLADLIDERLGGA